mmetsp:Transcript_31143/g.47618  ORF Transcript_31143/g.47618 Transcript_31143/m.47618 type:complete len:91 (-) Transcript_31143:776-1048(-)
MSENNLGVDRSTQIRNRYKVKTIYRSDQQNTQFKDEDCLVRFCQYCEPKYVEVCRRRIRDQRLLQGLVILALIGLVATLTLELFISRPKI